MKIVADENMPLVESLFSRFGDVQLVPGRGISTRQIADADVLLVRSVTRVNEKLLKGSKVRFVGSATIGTDHVELPCLEAQGITFASAPGCNANAVVNYVLAALSQVEPGWLGKTVGIIGCGNVGGAVYRALQILGVNCRCYDPFLTPRQQVALCSFDEVVAADILCLHTPLTTDGPFPTRHMFDAGVLASLAPGTLLLNAGRGGVVDNTVLKSELKRKRLRAILDVWENEPDIDPELLELVELGTPHIAGYSLEGRIRGTTMVHEAFCRWLGVTPQALDVASLADELDPQQTSAAYRRIDTASKEDVVSQVLRAYTPAQDCQKLLAALAEERPLGEAFDSLRKHYPLRREFTLV